MIVNINNKFILIRRSIAIDSKDRNNNYNVIIKFKINIFINLLIIIYFDQKEKAIKIHDFFIKIITFTIIILIKLYFLNLRLIFIKAILISHNVNKINVKIRFY